MKILCGDIGGTNSRLLVADIDGVHIVNIKEKIYPSQQFNQFDEVLDAFIQGFEDVPAVACFAVAGPIKNREAKITNLPWHLSETSLQAKYAFRQVALINDFLAVAYGITALDQADFRIIQSGNQDPQGVKVLLGAGTGLGVAQSIFCGDKYQALPSQGGHIAFGPTDLLQRDILQWMYSRQEYVSNEDLLSGKGLVNLYRYFARTSHQEDENWIQELLSRPDAPAVISQRAETGKDKFAVAALNQFVAIYGAVAGDMALLTLAYGGVYLAGGIAPKIINHLAGDSFSMAFRRKGPMSELMPQFPVSVILNERVGLIGAAVYASRSE